MPISIGFHVSVSGNKTGIGDHFQALDAAGIPICLVSIGDYGVIHEAVLLMRVSGVAHVLVYRVTDLDVPDYGLDAATAALNHWAAVKAKLPPEFDKERVWICPVNEIDKGRSDWLGNFATVFAATAIGEGYKVTMFGWSSGEPEPEHWQTEGMRRYLELCAIKPDRAAVALHEYSYEPDVLNVEFPYKIGRFQALFAACDAMGIARPTVHITEFGWTHEEVPPPGVAMPQIAWAHGIYSPHPQIKIAAVWGLISGFAGIANLAQRLIEPVTQFMLNAPVITPLPPPVIPPPAPPPAPPPSTYLHVRLIVAANIRRDASTSKPAITSQPAREGLELIKVADVSGQVVSGDGRWIKAAGFLSRSYVTDTAPGKVKTNRSVNLRTVPTVSNNWPIVTLPTGVEFEWLGNVKDFYNDGLWAAVALYVWRPLAIDVVPGLRLGSPLKIPLILTSSFNAQRDYDGDGVYDDKHEGSDFAVSIGNPVLAVAAGVVDGIRPVDPGTGYGKYVRLKHGERYKTWAGHLSRIDVVVGQPVTAGQQIGLSGNSGKSSGPHLYLTLQDIPQGLDTYIVDDVIDPTLYMHPVVSLLPAPAPPVPPPGTTYDLLGYMRGDGRQYELQYTWDGGGTHPIQTQHNGNIFYIVKGHSGEFEECYYDDKHIYRGIDSSEAPDRYYTQNTGNIYGAMWARRHMAIGETVTKSPLIIHYWKDGCRERLRGQPNDRLTLVKHYDSYRFEESGITLSDVLYLEWNDNEGYLFAKGYGLVGFSFAGGKSYISEIHEGRPDLQRNPIPCFQPGSRYYIP